MKVKTIPLDTLQSTRWRNDALYKIQTTVTVSHHRHARRTLQHSQANIHYQLPYHPSRSKSYRYLAEAGTIPSGVRVVAKANVVAVYRNG